MEVTLARSLEMHRCDRDYYCIARKAIAMHIRQPFITATKVRTSLSGISQRDRNDYTVGAPFIGRPKQEPANLNTTWSHV